MLPDNDDDEVLDDDEEVEADTVDVETDDVSEDALVEVAVELVIPLLLVVDDDFAPLRAITVPTDATMIMTTTKTTATILEIALRFLIVLEKNLGKLS
jgi:hypothetical protein